MMERRSRGRLRAPTASSASRRETGAAGEQAAAEWLLEIGYQIVERNWRCRSGEIDLIALDGGGDLAFVEVRSRRNPTSFGTAVEAVTFRKQAQVRAVAQVFLATHPRFAQRPIRFDAIAVTFGRQGGIADLTHLPGAF